jgi:2-phospho-L-lactate guanylyltransferase (CobY/MobA/RfbA family)
MTPRQRKALEACAEAGKVWIATSDLPLLAIRSMKEGFVEHRFCPAEKRDYLVITPAGLEAIGR